MTTNLYSQASNAGDRVAAPRRPAGYDDKFIQSGSNAGDRVAAPRRPGGYDDKFIQSGQQCR
ncbi:hypothetical protein [Rouxiella badensis]|uniref:hypothetical protein n=1 Tax=Rouxiella badensis TaxID=1646377 RepID=UPI0017889B73|nr:hypothetical protein [Rouxiella badensis]QOI58078.1 hypothetical protein H2866_23280 [Rouxiella badensis subsp. acadiensis]